MRLLVIDADRRLGELIRSVAARDGHSVWVAESAPQALSLGKRHQPQVILGALELGGDDGLQPLRTLRDSLTQTPDIILTSVSHGRYDPQVQAAMDTLQARDFLRQPLSVLDLMDMLRRLAASRPADAMAPATPEPTPAPARRVRVRNLVQLARIWSNRLSGVLTCIDPLRIRRTVPFGDGAPLRARDTEVVSNGLREGSFEFDRKPTNGRGHRDVLSTVLWEAATMHERANFAQANLYKAPVLTGALDALLALPISTATRGILSQADGGLLLGELLASARASRPQVSDDLAALDRMRLIAFQSPVSRSRHHSSGSNRSRISQPRRGQPPAGGVRPPTRTGPRTVTRNNRARSVAGQSTVANSVSRFSVSRSARRSVLSPKQVARIIAQDLERLPSSSPASVLMIAADAPDDERKKAARRLVRRYRGFAENRDISEDQRRQARRLQQFVVDAYKRLSAGDNTPIKSTGKRRRSVPATKDALLAEGLRLIQRREWVEADACLTRAQALDAADPILMAHLGWARLHNPRLDALARERDGAAQISLAYQFLPRNADVLFYMASSQLRKGQQEVVGQLLAAASRLHPDDARFLDLADALEELETPTVM